MNLKAKKLFFQSKASFLSKFQKGAGLIEVMVSLLILAVGLLGILSLQANGLNSGQRAVFTTETQMLAQDMSARILAFGNSSAGVNDNSYDGINVTKLSGTDLDDALADLAANPCNPCNAAATKNFDENEWQIALSLSSLPRARATVTRPLSGVAIAPFYSIKIMWDAERSGGAGPVDIIADADCADSSNCYELQVRVGS